VVKSSPELGNKGSELSLGAAFDLAMRVMERKSMIEVESHAVSLPDSVRAVTESSRTVQRLCGEVSEARARIAAIRDQNLADAAAADAAAATADASAAAAAAVAAAATDVSSSPSPVVDPSAAATSASSDGTTGASAVGADNQKGDAADSSAALPASAPPTAAATGMAADADGTSSAAASKASVEGNITSTHDTGVGKSGASTSAEEATVGGAEQRPPAHQLSEIQLTRAAAMTAAQERYRALQLELQNAEDEHAKLLEERRTLAATAPVRLWTPKAKVSAYPCASWLCCSLSLSQNNFHAAVLPFSKPRVQNYCASQSTLSRTLLITASPHRACSHAHSLLMCLRVGIVCFTAECVTIEAFTHTGNVSS
jgi:hypothetical protein